MTLQQNYILYYPEYVPIEILLLATAAAYEQCLYKKSPPHHYIYRRR